MYQEQTSGPARCESLQMQSVPLLFYVLMAFEGPLSHPHWRTATQVSCLQEGIHAKARGQETHARTYWTKTVQV